MNQLRLAYRTLWKNNTIFCFTSLLTYPSRIFTDCDKMIRLKKLHVTLHVSFTDLHGLQVFLIFFQTSQTPSRFPSRTLHGPSRIATFWKTHVWGFRRLLSKWSQHFRKDLLFPTSLRLGFRFDIERSDLTSLTPPATSSKESINQPTNQQSTNQPINNQSLNQSIIESLNHSINQSINNNRFSSGNPYSYRSPNRGGSKVLDPLLSRLPGTMGVSES